MIVVTFALPAESSDFLRLVRGRRDVLVVHTGVGRLVATERIRDAITGSAKPSLLISAGFAGALDDQLQVGDIFLADNFSDAAPLADARGAIADLRHHVGTMMSADGVVDLASERRELGRQTGALAVDMETQTIRQACDRAGIPMVSLRVISDTPAMPLPAPAPVLFDVSAQRTRVAPLALHLLKHPTAIARLARFGRQVAGCRRTLASAVELVVQARSA